MSKSKNTNYLIDFLSINEVFSLLKSNGNFVDFKYYTSYNITCYDGNHFYRIELRPKLSLFSNFIKHDTEELFTGEKTND